MPALPATCAPVRGRRRRLDPEPRFISPCPVEVRGPWEGAMAAIPQDHLAWKVFKLLEGFDASAAAAGYSSLGKRGYRPEWLLRTWVYASLIGLHHSTQIARAFQSDAAFRLLSTGYVFSESVLRKFRAKNLALFERAVVWTVELALKHGWADPKDLSVDSLRVQANASPKAVRTVERSTRRLKELAEVSTLELSEEQRTRHEAKVAKHTQALALCKQAGTASVVLTNTAAALMKFPHGAALPGHRVTLTAAGMKHRFAVGVLVDAAPTDNGKLEPAIREALRVMRDAGLPPETVLQVAADAGYRSEGDLLFAERARGWADILVAQESAVARSKEKPEKYFGRERFAIHADGKATCPVGRTMQGPSGHHHGRAIWTGDDCKSCPLKSQCTPGKQRSLTASIDLERARAAMQARMAQPGARERYNRRIATVEPVFSYIEGPMRFRRASCRLDQTVKAEIMLKVLAYNIHRLFVSPNLVVVLLVPWRSTRRRVA